ncbi:hypothetical protein N7478_011010 [Penicillium angulare]|uniref:uncharacterized protein n=1 Tax=Penicillium angulare TaxID=116970 RepID=UPI0025407E39|nr:uncharacterized protein N7478_011010 [Penicillium angulare]KAJ5263405.1 hypothetical protein N7478_011010 [Penicillium angulare]
MTHYRQALELSSAETLPRPTPGIPLLAFRSTNHHAVANCDRTGAETSRVRHCGLGVFREKNAKVVRYIVKFGW